MVGESFVDEHRLGVSSTCHYVWLLNFIGRTEVTDFFRSSVPILVRHTAIHENETVPLCCLTQRLENIQSSEFELTYEIIDEQSQGPVQTNLQRELLFLQSHTVHHYAIIGAMTRAFGNHTDDEFGVAIATRTHQRTVSQDSTEKQLGESICAQ